MSLVHNATGYDVVLWGVGFGIDEGDKKLDRSITVNGKEIPQSAISPSADGLAFHLVPADIGALFAMNTVERAPVILESTITRSCGLFGWGTCKQTYTTSFSLALLPRVAAKPAVEIYKSSPVIDSSTIRPSQNGDYSIGTCEAHNKPSCPVRTATYVPPPGWKVVKAEWTGCSKNPQDDGNPCAFFYNVTCPIAADQSSVYCYGDHQSHAVTRTYQFWIGKEITVSSPLPSATATLTYDNYSDIVYPENATLVRAQGNTTYGKPFSVVLLPDQTSAADPFQCNKPLPAIAGVIRQACIARPPTN
jgi:hypothetical protein